MDFKSSEGNNKHTAKTKVINIFLTNAICDMCLLLDFSNSQREYGNVITYEVFT